MEANELFKWPKTKPESLQDLCVFYVVNNVGRIVGSTAYRLMRTGNITLSHVLGNQLLDYLIDCCLPDISYFNINQTEDIQILFNKNFADITKIDLHSCNIQTLIWLGVLDALKEHRLNEITLRCPLLENEVAAFTSLIQSQVNSLKKLTIPDTPDDNLRRIFFYEEENHPSVREPDVFRDLTDRLSSMTTLESSSQHPAPSQKMIIFPNLTSLHLHTQDPGSIGDVLMKHKTLLSCGIYTTTPLYDHPYMEPIPSTFLESLQNLKNLSSLCLVQSSLRTDAFEYLANLQNLRLLDISFCTMEDGEDMESSHIHLVNLVQRLPKLVSLDITYTRFGGIIQSLETHGEGEPGEIAVLPGLEGRWFDFLGLWNVIPEVCGLKNIPANRITGTACEEQIINALYTYHNNIPLMNDVIAHIEDIKLYEPKDPYHMLRGVQLGLRTLLSQTEELIIVRVFFKLFCRWYKSIPQIQYREILVLILIIINNQMQPAIEEINRVGQTLERVMYPCRNVMVYLISILDTGPFADTAVYSYCFEQYVDTLCRLLKLMNPYCVRRNSYVVLGAKVLYSACLVGVENRIQMGEMGIMQRLLELASSVTDFLYMKLEKPFLITPHHFFQYMSILWWIIFHLTDELPENSTRFCSDDGVTLFIRTVLVYNSGDLGLFIKEAHDDLSVAASGMIATLSNVSEVQSLRTHLMNGDFIRAVRCMLQYSDENHNVDTSIRCVCILLQMLSFPLKKWLEENISPFDALEHVRKSIFSWDIRVKRETSYISLQPVFTLLEHVSFPKEEARYVAAWILCNLTTVDAEVYCDMLCRENGVQIIKRVYRSLGKDEEKTKKLLTDVMHNMTEYFTV